MFTNTSMINFQIFYLKKHYYNYLYLLLMEYIIGITAYYHDSSACLFKGSELLFACEEERFTGIKHDRSFPTNVLMYIYEKFNLTKDDIKVVCYYEDPRLKGERVTENLKENFFKAPQHTLGNYVDLLGKVGLLEEELLNFSNDIYFSEHHKSHLYYSYYTSPYEKSYVVAVDGVGEKDTLTYGFATPYGVTYSSLGKYPHSLGLYYSAMTSYLGFKPNEGEYKLMGLASYGDPKPYLEKVRQLVSFNNELQCNMKYFTWDKSKRLMFNEKLCVLLDVLPRLPEDEITTTHKNLAASVQQVYEEILFEVLNHISHDFLINKPNLCLGGGCAYNGRANGKILDKTNFGKLWIPASPSDSGSSIGACIAYLVERELFRGKIKAPMFIGPEYSISHIEEAIYGHKYEIYDNNEKLNRYIAKEISEGKIVGWFNGKIELGSRALGNRSILADPRSKEIKDKINKVVKRREMFRPFAPMVIKEKQYDYFDMKQDIPYMNQIVEIKMEHRDSLEAITHVDGTSRPQTVYKDNSTYGLLTEFEKLTGFPILLNTSFNVKDSTMVLTPKNAIDTFFDTEMDILVLGRYVLTK